MKIAFLGRTTFPSCLPDDPQYMNSYYGSEMHMAVLANEFATGNEVHFFAPFKSSRIGSSEEFNTFHPLIDTKGLIHDFRGPIDDLLENISLHKESYTDLLTYDFVVSWQTFHRNIEELKMYHHYNRYCCFQTGFNDYYLPSRLDMEDRHYVTHCDYFADIFEEKTKVRPDVAHFGLSDFWCPPNYDFEKSYFLFPHRISPQKGIDYIRHLAMEFPDEEFKIQTSTPLQDHVLNMEAFKKAVSNLSNIEFVEIPQNKQYHFNRRNLIRNAKAVLSPFTNNFFSSPGSPYYDTGGLVSMEAIACGTPVIVTRSPGSTELLGHQEDKGAIFFEGYDALKYLVKRHDFASMKPAPLKWTLQNYVQDYVNIMKKYSN